MKIRTLLALAAACTALAGCFGGGGGDDNGGGAATTPVTGNDPGNGVPQSALASVAGLVAYLQTLIAGSSDTAQPVSLDGVTLPVDDTAPPASI
jgi:hypothetical protein